jgi:hypothetical protein
MRRLLPIIAVLVLFLVTGCIEIKDVRQPDKVKAGDTIQVQLNYQAGPSERPDRGFLAVRLPDGWSVVGAQFNGPEAGNLVAEPKIISSLSGRDDVPNKPGYSWWGGVTERSILNKSQSSGSATVTIKVGPNAGSYWLDYGAGTWSGSIAWVDSKYFDRPINVEAAAPAQTQVGSADCQFVLGFKALRDMIPDKVGTCKASEHHNPTNGDGLQETAGVEGKGGLMVWRKADNWTAYTDGYRTWINGPAGLQMRLNTQRFAWEPDASQFELVR